jgi:hypothetical protein
MRKWLARKLYPEAFEKAERYDWLASEVATAQRWLGEFGQIRAFIEWLHGVEGWYFHRGLPLPPQPKWRTDISAFREQLRKCEPTENTR